MFDAISNQKAELLDFANGVSRPRNIEFLQRVTFGAVTIGRYSHNSNDGAIIGTAQCSVMVHEGAIFEMDWRLLDDGCLARRSFTSGNIQIHPCNMLVYKQWQIPSRMLFLAVDRALADRVVAEAFDRRPME